MNVRGAAFVGVVMLATAAAAGPADVLHVDVTQETGDRWRFAVTVQHADRDPDHWADWWRVRTPDGRELGRRVLLHSHVDEQPFIRDEIVRVPANVRLVVVEAHDKIHGLGGRTLTVDLGTSRCAGYTVKPQ